MFNFCNPLVFFIILVSIWIVLLLFTNVPNKSAMILQAVLWGVLLGIVIYYLCSIGKINWAWFVVFLPLILTAVIMLVAVLGFSFGLGYEAGRKTPMIASYLFESKKK
jgi:hypothetical protein